MDELGFCSLTLLLFATLLGDFEMTPDKVARENHEFYYVAVAMSLCSTAFPDFGQAVVHSLYDESGLAQFGVEFSHYSGYIRIDTSQIGECFREGLANEVWSGIFGRMACAIPSSISGEMNTEVVLREGIYRFTFKIAQYERDAEHGWEIIDDPIPLPDDEKLGRVVNLCITIDHS